MVVTVGLSASELSVKGLNGRRGLSEIPMSVERHASDSNTRRCTHRRQHGAGWWGDNTNLNVVLIVAPYMQCCQSAVLSPRS